ncbi:MULTISPECIES: FCD domain-containing protein [unclassified Photobacterium]|uniref:GntR family transcriptional regulator n=1 Tax=unclassified Photobacterium TaxID=2628852 RepID=UPI000D155CFB|nr:MULTISPECIES: FCD domain-containing protein [unclassified Photobacterium]PSV41582.1 XRE family transcriptional regulator [Photobacterium sp. GB-36]PSV51063.1 XRE family transcriptional regulator [Photobacterium sp. GB-1]PSV53231.1 XRE family transcriptional regulator [Photobacterium sp. GB-3]PSW71850.1 XRE family transcriptional regulator [Photobacterium sp. GB-50]
MVGMTKDNFATISDRVMCQIRHDILCGEFEAGQKLILSELKERYQVGGTPLREAMVQLTWQKYVKMEPQKGFWVADVSLDELRGILKARLALGHVALKDAIKKGDEAWELQVLTAFHKLNRLDPESALFDYDEWELRHKEFHLSLVACEGSEFILDMISNVYDQQERYRHFLLSANLSPEKQYHDNGEHEALMKAVLSRNVELSCQLLKEHGERLYQILEKAPSLKALLN